MNGLIIFAVVLLLLFLTRNLWASVIGSIVKRIKTKKTRNNLISEPSAIFSPAGIKRTFIIALDIEELGNGEINISLAKLKREKELKE
jgi:hypothetical protein